MRTLTHHINATISHTDVVSNRAQTHCVEETSLIAVIKVNIKGDKQ